ncbi:MAG TPA: isoprenylcysteine carboxylmethyltransferase family protein [Terriglobales bacterium]|nr:isoprenylcysteine carboxylmethyltransferase family protein [Terriglobales bacterium]
MARRADPRLVLELLGGVVYSTGIFGILLFLPAWTLHWWRGWVFVGVVLVASSVTMFGVFAGRPELLEERYRSPLQKNQPLVDKVLTPLLVLGFLAFVAFIPLDVFRFHLLGGTGSVPAALGLALFVGGWTLLALAMRDNPFAAPVVKAQHERGQTVVRTGLYRFVRHPMYAGAIPLMLGIPLWLGSRAGLLVAIAPLVILVLRVGVEESLLQRELPDYADYARAVRWRLVPGIW